MKGRLGAWSGQCAIGLATGMVSVTTSASSCQKCVNRAIEPALVQVRCNDIAFQNEGAVK
jgi:hypothetical protein